MLRYVNVDLTLRQRHFEREKNFVFRSNAGQSKLTALKAKNVRRFCVCVGHLSLSCIVFMQVNGRHPLRFVRLGFTLYAMEIKNGTIFWFVFMSLSLVANVWSMKFYLCWHFCRFLGQLSRFVWIASEVTTSWDLETSQVYDGSEAWVWIQVRVRVGLRVDGSASDFKSSTVRVKLWPGYFFSHFPLRDNKRVASPYMCDFKVGAKLNAK